MSPATVSRVFNRSDLVHEQTRAHIMDVAQRLRYVPNASARSLSTNKTHVLGLVLPLPYSEFFTEMIRGMDEAALETSYNLLISGSHNRIEDTRSAFRMMKGRVDGFLVISPNIEIDALADAIPDGIPAIFLHSRPPKQTHYSLCIDNHDGAYQATRHLLALGHRRIAIISGPAVNQESLERLEGYRQALRESGVMPDPALVFPGSFTYESGVEAARAILQLNPRPTAIFALNDAMAIGVLHVLIASAIQVPEDVALIGFDDIPSARFASPSLSTVHVPIYEMGKRAVQMLIAAVEGGAHEVPHAVVLFPRLVARASTLGAQFQGEPVS